MRQSPVPTDNVPPLRPVSIQALASLVVGNFHPSQTTVNRIVDHMQTPIGALAAGNTQHGGVVDPEHWPGGRLGPQLLRQQMRQDLLQQRRSLAQTVEDGSVFQFQRGLGGPGGGASQGEIFDGVC